MADDGDQMPSWWETQNGLDPATSNADTRPMVATSYFPNIPLINVPPGTLALQIGSSSTGRIYFVESNTNLLASPQAWTLYGAELTGTAGTITYTVTNNVPGRNCRTGVRLP